MAAGCNLRRTVLHPLIAAPAVRLHRGRSLPPFCSRAASPRKRHSGGTACCTRLAQAGPSFHFPPVVPSIYRSVNLHLSLAQDLDPHRKARAPGECEGEKGPEFGTLIRSPVHVITNTPPPPLSLIPTTPRTQSNNTRPSPSFSFSATILVRPFSSSHLPLPATTLVPKPWDRPASSPSSPCFLFTIRLPAPL